MFDGERACRKVIANRVPTAAMFKYLILLLFFLGTEAATGLSMPSGHFLPEPFTSG
jgi:hypothetical protein